MDSENLKAAFKSTWHRGNSIAVACCLMMANVTAAMPFPNPDPGSVLDDLDGSGYFTTGSIGSLSFELFDLGDSATSFGLFSQSSPETLIPIFEANDLIGEAAIIDFAVGYVFDYEIDVIQILFDDVPVVGFYLDFATFILYSDPTLNEHGLDVMGAFPSASDDFLSLMFFDGPANYPQRSLLSWHLISDVNATPVPATWLLMMVGLGLLAAKRTTRLSR